MKKRTVVGANEEWMYIEEAVTGGEGWVSNLWNKEIREVIQEKGTIIDVS